MATPQGHQAAQPGAPAHLLTTALRCIVLPMDTDTATPARCTIHPAFDADYCPVCGTTTPVGDR